MSRQPTPHKRKPIIDAGNTRAYRQLWRVVDGAVFDALYTHQDYLTPKGHQCARNSINKRVVGSVLGFAEQSARSRSGELPAADRDGRANPSDPRMAATAMSKWRAILLGVARRLRLPVASMNTSTPLPLADTPMAGSNVAIGEQFGVAG